MTKHGCRDAAQCFLFHSMSDILLALVTTQELSVTRAGETSQRPCAPGHGEEGDAAVVGLGLGHDAVVALVDGAPGPGNARMLVRPVGLVVRGQPQREVQIVRRAHHHRPAVPHVSQIQHLRQ